MSRYVSHALIVGLVATSTNAGAVPPLVPDDMVVITPQKAAPPPKPPAPDLYDRDRVRFEAGIGARFGSFLVNGTSVGTVVPGHLDAGLRRGRLLVNSEYQLMSLELPDDAFARGAMSHGNGRGLMHRLGGNARYSYARNGESDCGGDLWVEGGVGIEHFRWDAGGVWTRPDLALGLGGSFWGLGEQRHGGFSVGLRITLAHRDDTAGAPVACGGPCDRATTPTGWDRSFLFDMTVMFGK